MIFPIRPKVDANIDCMAGLMAVIEPDTFVRVNWVKSCCRDDKLVAVVAADVAAPLVCTGDIRFGVRLWHTTKTSILKVKDFELYFEDKLPKRFFTLKRRLLVSHQVS